MVQIITNQGGGGGVGLYKYKGSVDYYEDLPTSGLKVGDTYNVVNAFTKDGKDYPAGTNVAWTGSDRDPLGGSIDLSDYQKKLVEGEGIDLDQDTNEISVDTTVIATKQDLTTKQDVISDLDTIRSGAALGATAVQPGDNVSELVNDAGYLVSSDLKQADWGQSDSSKIDYIKNKPTIGNATLTIQRNGTQVNTFTANATSNVTANISVPTKTSDITNDSGFIDKDVNNLTNYTLTTSLATVATSGSYNDLSNKPSIPTKTSDLTNDSGFIDKDVNNLTNYTLSSDLAAVATSGSYNDLSNKPTIGTANLTIQKNGTNVATFGANATSGVTANITVPTAVTDLSDASNYALKSSLATVATSGDYNDLDNLPTIPSVIDNTTSTSTTDALSANQGKLLKDAIDGLSGLGKFLSLWNSATGLPLSFPLSTPYTYSTGDWYMVETIGTTNYMPNGSSYTGTASTTVDSTNTVKQGDVYIYDGTNWIFQENNRIATSFSAITGQPTDNANLSTALSAKQDVANMVTSLTGADNAHYPTAKAVADALSSAGAGDMLKATYDPNNVSANAFDYNNFINTPSLAAVATSGSYNDLSNIPTFAAVATSGSYNDLTNKPTIPTVNNATLTIQKNGTTVKTFTANASTDVTANISVPTKTSDITNDSGYITKSVNNLDNYTLSSALATVATTGSYSDLSNKPTIPTDTSDLTNGAGFITSSDLSSGSGISISGTTISNSGVLSVNGNTGAVTVSEFTPGSGTTGQILTKTATGYAYCDAPATGIQSSNNTYDNVIHLTQAEYDNLGTYDSETLYSTPDGEAGTFVDNTAFGASWDGATDKAPSMNAVYDKVSTIAGVPSGGDEGQVLTKTASGCEWANASGGGGGPYADLFIVGGGGGGGSGQLSGGGGAGGVIQCIKTDIQSGACICIGGGGVGGCNGGNSSVGNIIAYGGGGGGRCGFMGKDGGSGGGSGCIRQNCSQCRTTGVLGQGHGGGLSVMGWTGGGGGGAGGQGGDGSYSLCYGVAGGAGICTNFFGTDCCLAGGGAGGGMCDENMQAIGYTGAGGGGKGRNGGQGKAGVVGIRYPTDGSYGINCATGGTVTTCTINGTEYKIHTFTSDGTFTIVS